MSTPSSSIDSPADERFVTLFALNDQLLALDQANVTIGLGIRGNDLKDRFAALRDELTGGMTLERAFDTHSTRVSPPYDHLVRAWLDGADLTQLLSSLRVPSNTVQMGRNRLTLRLVYPAFVAILACLGLAFSCYTTLPLFEATYADLREPVSPSVAWLQAIRSLAPLWIWAIPLVLILSVLGLRYGNPLRLSRGSWELGAQTRGRLAQMSHQTAALIEARVPHDEAVQVAMETNASRWPPLLAWANRANHVAAGDDAGNFRAIGDVYRELSRRGVERFTTITPLVACLVIGGGATLLYALALFLPLVELFWRLAF